jgi:hypothetical protein
MCLSHLIYTVRPCLIQTCHAAPMSCSDHAVLIKATALHGRRETAVLCCDLEKNGMVRAWHGRGMASVNQTRPHCVNQMGKTHSKPLAARNGRGTAWARPAMCESALRDFILSLPVHTGPDAGGRQHRGCSIPQTVTHSLVLLKMGKIIARNMLSWLELLISRYCCI